MADSKLFNIIDKNPRKPLKEGPKAQEAYCESLKEDWDRDMVAEAKAAKAARRSSEGPDPATRALYAQREAEFMDRYRQEQKRKAEAAKKFVTRASGLIVPGGYGS